MVGLYGDAVPAGRRLPAFAFTLKVVSEALWPQVHAVGEQHRPALPGSLSPELFHLWGNSSGSPRLAGCSSGSLELGGLSKRGNLGGQGSWHPPSQLMLVMGTQACCLGAALLAPSAPSPESLVGPAEPTLKNTGSGEVLQHCTGHRRAFCSVLERFWLFAWSRAFPGEQSG